MPHISGFDAAVLKFEQNVGTTVNIDEITQYWGARFVSATKAMWRILEFKLHDISHSVIRLTVHDENEQIFHCCLL